MQRWGLFGIVFLFSVNIAVAQSVNFTVTLSGPAAPVGRLFIFSEDKGEILTSLGACPFQIADGDVSSLDVFGPLSADQLTSPLI